MSQEGPSFWLTMTEKLIGIVLIIVSIIMLYFTATSTTTLTVATGLFTFLGVLVLASGAFFIVVKPPE
jgi:hypothetical protein